MPINIRLRPSGKSWELRITHKLLAKDVYLTCRSEDQAREVGQQSLDSLARGIVPEGLLPAPKFEFTDIAGAIRAYERAFSVKHSTSCVLRTVTRDIGATPLSAVNYSWSRAWIREQKLKFRRAPGTIRHHVGALSLCLTWVTNAHPTYLSANPLEKMKRGYAGYNEVEIKLLKEDGFDEPTDQEINRRLEKKEEAAVVRILKARIHAEKDSVQKAWHEGALLIFRIALESAMRLRELYTLTWKQIDIPGRTFRLTRTKNGDNRNVPMTSVAVPLMQAALDARGKVMPADLVFPFWNGVKTDAVLKATTSEVSKYFGVVFGEADAADFGFHQTRSEAICRMVLWVPKKGPQITETALARVTGHKDPRMLRRYFNLRGSELATLLW